MKKIITLYARLMSTRDINECINKIYDVEVSPEFISKVTDKIYPILFIYRIKDILGFWISESESIKQWMNVLITCSDNLKAISDAIHSVYQNGDIQKYVVYQIRNSMKFVWYDYMKEFTMIWN